MLEFLALKTLQSLAPFLAPMAVPAPGNAAAKFDDFWALALTGGKSAKRRTANSRIAEILHLRRDYDTATPIVPKLTENGVFQTVPLPTLRRS
jgi:hypothetical protein